MNEDDEARLAKAAMKSLIAPAPESLKADLKRMARGRKRAPSIWDGLREALSGGAWAYGAGAAFAAAAIGVFILRAVPGREAPADIAEHPAPRVEAAAPQALADLWSDDDGEDNDEI
ncbi:MAG: hypothetical protein PHS14_19335 [Elusimicrobia bacterium]|nr:hypothetical protein [Elusimicrobiota bacterium]